MDFESLVVLEVGEAVLRGSAGENALSKMGHRFGGFIPESPSGRSEKKPTRTTRRRRSPDSFGRHRLPITLIPGTGNVIEASRQLLEVFRAERYRS
jgi:hypothetical protein